jgi:ElaA protein
MTTVHHSLLRDLDPVTLHDLLALRINVFVVEQKCAYPELDGRDVEPGTAHLWTADEQGPTAYLRVLAEPNGSARVGRVCTRIDARGQGLAGLLMDDALARAGTGRVVVLEAQEYLAGWYARFGFVPTAESYLDDGIMHIPMRREAQHGALTAQRSTKG